MRADAQVSPQLYARTIGVLYLIVILAGFFAYGYVPGRLVSGNATVTASNLLAHSLLWRAGVLAGLIVVICGIPQAWAALAIDLHDADLNISFLFFGCVCLLYGYLIFRSTFLPRFLGVLMTVAGLCYAANSILSFLDLHFLPASGIPLLLLPAGLAELILCLWLLIVGVNVPKWHHWTKVA